MSIKAGATSQSIPVFIADTSGNPLTGLAHNTASLTCYYARAGAAAVAITLATQTAAGAWSSGGFCAIDGTNMPGWYRLDLPNAAIASDAPFVGLVLKGAASMTQTNLLIDLVAFDPQNATTLGLTNLDAAISSRAATGAAMTLSSGAITAATIATGAIDADALAADAATEIATAVASAITLTPFAVLGLRTTLSGVDPDDYIPVIGGDDKSVGIFFEDGSGNPAPIPTGATAAMLDSAGTAVGTATVTDSKVQVGYLLIRLQVPGSGNRPSTLRITFNGGSGGAYKHDIPMRAWS